MNPKLIELVGKVLLGSHPKSSWGGYVVGGLLLIWQAFVVWKGGEINGVAVTSALAAIGIGRSYREPPAGPTSGSYSPSSMLVLFIGVVVAGTLLMLCSGCNKTMNLDGAFNATDGKIAGIVPDETAAPLVAKAYKPAGDWLNQQADMARLYQSLPNGLALNYGIRHKGAKDGWIDLADYEQVYWFDPIITPLTLPAPNFGSRIKPTPIVGTKPIPDSPTAPAAPDSPPVGGGGVGDLLEPDVNSTLEVKQ